MPPGQEDPDGEAGLSGKGRMQLALKSSLSQGLDARDEMIKKILAENERLKAQLAAQQTRRTPASSAPATPRTPTPSGPRQHPGTGPSPSTESAAQSPPSSGRSTTASINTKSEDNDHERELCEKLRATDQNMLDMKYDLSAEDCS